LPGPWGLSTGTTFADTGYQSSWEVSRAQRGTSGILVGHAGGSGAVEMAQVQPAPHTTAWDPRTGALAGRFLSQLEPVYPGISLPANGRALLSLPQSDPNALLSYSYPGVGQYHTILGYAGVPQGNVHFTGEHCSLEFGGYMEGGAREGIRVANDVLARLGTAAVPEAAAMHRM